MFKLKWIGVCALSLMFCFASCTKGQDSDPGTEGTITAGGSEAQEDVCEKPENLDNILCQWVASEMTVSFGPQTAQMLFTYDEKGRLTEFSGTQGGMNMGVFTVRYNENGLWKTYNYSAPNPPESKDWTIEEITTYNYNDEGKLESVNGVTNDGNGVRQKSSNTIYQYFPQQNLRTENTSELDQSYNTTYSTNKTIHTDPNSGNTDWIEIKEGIPGMFGGTLKHWTKNEYQYYPQLGRMMVWYKESQMCEVLPCGADLQPTQAAQYTYEYDNLGRMKALTVETDGDPWANPVVPVDGTYEEKYTCEITYEIQTQAEIAGKHPLKNFADIQNMTSFDLGYNTKDIFSSLSCQNTSFSLKWVRLWEALPGGQPPGGAE